MRITNNGFADQDRVKFPRVYAYNTNGTNGGTTATNAAATRIFMSYYDNNSSNNDNLVLFQYGIVGANYNTNAANAATGYGFGGNLLGNNAVTAYNVPGNAATNATTGIQVVARATSEKAKSGPYTAVGGLSTGRPVIAWYDSTNMRLWFSYGGGAPTSNTAPNNSATNIATSIVATSHDTWQANAVAVKDFAGTHVDMAVDGGDNVHLAFYDVLNGGLWYAYIPYGNDNLPNKDNITVVKVDTYLSAGTKIMLNVRNEATATGPKYVPYITYLHASFAETRNSVRVAWLNTAVTGNGRMQVLPGTDETDFFTGNWEVMTVPARGIALTDEFVCNGVPIGNGRWLAPVATPVPAGAPAATALRGYGTNGNSINQTILVAYMTSDFYEGAVLKHSLWTP
jgi:hypothetical protein